MKSLKIIWGFIILLLLSCNQSYVKSVYPLPSKQLFKKQLYYKDKYGYLSSLSDTIVNDGKLYRIYKGGVLNEIGKLDETKRVGYWFIFKDSLELEYILRYNINRTDSFYHPFSIIHQSW